MARRHGWQLPAHTLQVVAVTVFFLLAIAFYAFFAPFLERDFDEYLALGIYSFLAFSVLVLYVRCTAIDPADPGILNDVGGTMAYKSQIGEPSEEPDKLRNEEDFRNHNVLLGASCICCAIFVKEDCRKDFDVDQDDDGGDEALFCTLCNAEVYKNSKHCRSCDKCVYGFDHHCRWLNNCVGRKNYITFLFLMAMSLAWLAVEIAVGITVLFRCFADKGAVEIQIGEKLGDGFSRAPFATIVAICTALSILASVPLGELFFFHMILIRKGITTYEYVVAMRAQTEPPGPSVNEDPLSQHSSPISSAATTAISGNSFGLHHRGAWCTPPRIFMDQDEIIPHLEPGRVPSTVDPDSMDPAERAKRSSKRPVRISAWKLAKLDSNEAVKAAAKARASSSVLKPVGARIHYDSDKASSENDPGRNSTVDDISIAAGRTPRLKASYPPSRASHDDVDTCPQTPSSLSTNSFAPTPLAEQPLPPPLNTKHFNPIYQTSGNRTPVSARSPVVVDLPAPVGPQLGGTRKSTAADASRSSRSSVYWDPDAGRFVSAGIGQGPSVRQAELMLSGPSIFFGGPLTVDSMRSLGETSGTGSSGGATSGRRPGWADRERRSQAQQLPVFVPSDPQRDYFSRYP